MNLQLHAGYHDLTLNALNFERSLLSQTYTSTLVDENAAILVDESGNELTATYSGLYSYILHAIPDDFTLNAE